MPAQIVSSMAIGRTSDGVVSHWMGSSMRPHDRSCPLMNPVRSKSQRHESPIAIEPLTAGTK
jgi:hypothetical protein